jgi:hypothetical protein
MRVKASNPFMSPFSRISTSGPMISCTSPPEEKFPSVPVRTTTLTSGTNRSRSKVSRSSA